MDWACKSNLNASVIFNITIRLSPWLPTSRTACVQLSIRQCNLQRPKNEQRCSARSCHHLLLLLHHRLPSSIKRPERDPPIVHRVISVSVLASTRCSERRNQQAAVRGRRFVFCCDSVWIYIFSRWRWGAEEKCRRSAEGSAGSCGSRRRGFTSSAAASSCSSAGTIDSFFFFFFRIFGVQSPFLACKEIFWILVSCPPEWRRESNTYNVVNDDNSSVLVRVE